MGKTIKEMAYNSLLKENVRSTESDYSRGYLKGYESGANAVLQEIEKITNTVLDWPEYAFDEIVEKIKQLKGDM